MFGVHASQADESTAPESTYKYDLSDLSPQPDKTKADAEKGDPEAQFSMGFGFLGTGASQDYVAAERNGFVWQRSKVMQQPSSISE